MRKLGLVILGLLLLAAGAAIFLPPRAKPHRHSVTLAWKAALDSPNAKVVSYNIYRSTSPGGPYARLASGVQQLTYKDELVNAGRTYYYVVKSVDSSGRESQPSEEVRATVPTP
jgi:fibronectin type 3 domain-containing protein